uniref:DUF3615 domain-containing protein n=1 Tax=Leersia perrieri TaxID=77586 RepID=A0A0D9W182_9ORYZ
MKPRCSMETEEEKEEEVDQEEQEKREEERIYCLPSEEVRDGYFIHKAHAALHYYNINHPGAEYDLVKPLMAARVFCRADMWSHVSLSARRRGQVAPPVEYFFAEVRDGPFDSQPFIVESCTMIENPQSCSGNKCSMCPERYRIVHPSERELLCGKNLAPLPFTCPVAVPAI